MISIHFESSKLLSHAPKVRNCSFISTSCFKPLIKVLKCTLLHEDWDFSAWVRTYALFLEERLECFRILKYDIEAERWSKSSRQGKGHSRTTVLARDDLLEQLLALQQLLYRLICCQPEGSAFTNYLIQYALALVLKESFKIYCAINDGIIDLMDLYFEMSTHDAIKALNIIKEQDNRLRILLILRVRQRSGAC